MALLDLLGRRWVLRIMWELRDEPAGFRQLQLRCDEMSPSVLSQRLDELKEAEVLELLDEQYRLTDQGLDWPSGFSFSGWSAVATTRLR